MGVQAPDTGCLEQDLRDYAATVVRDVSEPDGLAELRRAVASSAVARDAYVVERGRRLQEILDHARERGEHPPEALDVVDHIVAPMCLRALLGMGPLTASYVDRLVQRVLTLTWPLRP
jgi:hypothetical protein